ncbi:MAG: matrixin family metalloprotease [Silicimonas sp.]|nr:matrixin family metalloprotease [Silicimonas sp.]RZW11775.1 MAG: matrixin family metalloprotease [Paracoccaceae bacterium]
MPFSAGDVKWGTPTLGTPSGVVTWSADYVSGLMFGGSSTAGDFDAALSAAFDTWENVASIDFQQVSAGSSADVTVGSVSLGSSVAGQASYSFGANPGLSEIFSGSVTFNADMNWSPTGGAGTVDFFAVALHEIGHIIGLGHVNDVSEIMNPVVAVDVLGAGDIAGAQYLYGRDSGDPATPSGEPNQATPSPGVSSSDGGGGGGAGLLLGLLAAIVGLIFGGGAAAGAVLAGRVSQDDTADDDHKDGDGHDDAMTDDGLLVHSHDVYVADLPLPMVAHAEEAGPCGCYGPCECLLEEAYAELLV